jgi:hypothetical protein
MAVDTIPSTPPTAVVHQRTEVAKRFQAQQAKEATNQQEASRQEDKEVIQERRDRIADDSKASDAKAAEETSYRVDIRA